VLGEPSDVGVGTLLVGKYITASGSCTVLYKGDAERGIVMIFNIYYIFTVELYCETICLNLTQPVRIVCKEIRKKKRLICCDRIVLELRSWVSNIPK